VWQLQLHGHKFYVACSSWCHKQTTRYQTTQKSYKKQKKKIKDLSVQLKIYIIIIKINIIEEEEAEA